MLPVWLSDQTAKVFYTVLNVWCFLYEEEIEFLDNFSIRALEGYYLKQSQYMDTEPDNGWPPTDTIHCEVTQDGRFCWESLNKVIFHRKISKVPWSKGKMIKVVAAVVD